MVLSFLSIVRVNKQDGDCNISSQYLPKLLSIRIYLGYRSIPALSPTISLPSSDRGSCLKLVSLSKVLGCMCMSD